MEKSLLAQFELKEVDEDARTFSGLAATYDRDLGGDVIMPGAFKRTLKAWKSSKRPLPLLDSHNAFSSIRNVVGKMDSAEETKDGLDATFEVIDGPDGDEIFRRVSGGYVDGLSIGYQAIKVKYPETEEERAKGIYRYLHEVKLREVSVVLFPLNEGARIDTTAVKALLIGWMGKDDAMDEEDMAELQALQHHISVLLAKAEMDNAPDGPTPEEIEELQGKIALVMATQLATRIDEVQHSAGLLEL